MGVDVTVRVGHLYPAEMSLYGDRGNVLALIRRLQWRGMGVEVVPIEPGSLVDWDAIDLLFMGGGEDSHQVRIADDFLHRAEAIVPRLERGLPMLAICGAYQLLGQEYVTADGRTLSGAGFLDVRTEAGSHRRQIGNVVAEVGVIDITPKTLVGFENHGGRTFLGPRATPLASVGKGSGNNGTDCTEGAIRNHVIGTYLHGSLLPKNPQLADRFLEWTLAYKASGIRLEPLGDHWEYLAHTDVIARYGRLRGNR